MGLLILLALILAPLIEIGVFIEVGGALGLWPTLGLIVLTALLGAWQLRVQGLATLTKARAQMDRGVMPARELFDGLCLLAAGALLLTPGFVTDALGALLFVPPFRDFLRRRAAQHVAAHGEVYVHASAGRRPPGGGDVIDGDYRDVTDSEPKDPPPKLKP